MITSHCLSIGDASYNNCIDCVRKFIDDGFTPLHFASYEIAKLTLLFSG